ALRPFPSAYSTSGKNFPDTKRDAQTLLSVAAYRPRRILTLGGTMKIRVLFIGSLLATGLHAAIIFTSSTATTAAGLQPAIDAFRASIGGGTVAGANGSFGGVRREVNWDAVPDNVADPSLMPATFFINNSPRGLGLSGPVNGFMVSANPGQPSA